MIKTLKVAMIVFAVVEIIFGLLIIFSPDKLLSMAGVSEVTGYLKYIMALLGICLITPSIFLIMAARDPVRQINWVRFAILWFLLATIAAVYAIAKSYVTFSHAGTLLIVHAVFAVVLFALYPRRANPRSK